MEIVIHISRVTELFNRVWRLYSYGHTNLKTLSSLMCIQRYICLMQWKCVFRLSSRMKVAFLSLTNVKLSKMIRPSDSYKNRHQNFTHERLWQSLHHVLTNNIVRDGYQLLLNSFLVTFVNVHQSQKYTSQTLQEALVFIVIIIDCFMLIMYFNLKTTHVRGVISSLNS